MDKFTDDEYIREYGRAKMLIAKKSYSSDRRAPVDFSR